ncbi:MAG: hypothetical protein Q9M36_13310 [Sulfurovum sp.]|nr:hypothetical protein [Sulfurovum sp.]
MKHIFKLFIGAFLLLSSSIIAKEAQNLQIFSADNSKGSITAKSIEKAFNASGVVVDVNNDMNSIFFQTLWKSPSQKLQPSDIYPSSISQKTDDEVSYNWSHHPFVYVYL